MAVRKRIWTTRKGEEKTAWMVDYADMNGVRRQKSFRLKKDADSYFAKVKVDISEGTHVADRATVTIAQAGDNWLTSCKAAGLERTTTDQYENHLELHIKPYVGRTLLSKLTVPGVRALQDRLRDEGRSPAMIKRVTVSLGSIIADAQERGLVAQNVVREMAQRRGKGRDRHIEKRQKARLRVGVDIPTPAEIGQIIQAAEGRYRPLLLTAIFAGLRASELRGLRWADVDLDKRVLHIRQRADRYHAIGMPKSDAGQRTIPLPPLVVNTLRKWKLRCPKSDLDLVFPTGTGAIEYHANIVKRGLIPTQVAAGVTADSGKKDKEGNPILTAKYPGLHALRHFYASWCINRIEDGGLALPPKAVQERMGHSSITMTMDVYGHLFPSADDSDALAEAERRLLASVNAT